MRMRFIIISIYKMTRKLMTLADLKPGQTAIVAGFSEFDAMTLRIMQLGKAPFSDPIEIRVMDYSLSLRREEAHRIQIRAVA